MTEAAVTTLSENELDVLVSIAIRRAEVLEDTGSSSAQEAWLEVLVYEERLAAITRASDLPGGVARAGAVHAALAAGRREDAERLARLYLGDPSLPEERRRAIERAIAEEDTRMETHFPALARSGRLSEVQKWRRIAASKGGGVFPRAA
jgi:biopolymer transport protein ExbB/TolQ